MFTIRSATFHAVLTLCLVFTTHVAMAHAQTRAVVNDAAPIYLKPDDRMDPLRTAAAGTVLLVRETQRAWVQVEFADPQFGRRIGWIQRSKVDMEAPHTRPLDLSVAGLDPDPSFTPEAANAAPDSTRPDAPLQERGWLDVNLGAAWSGDQANGFTWLGVLYREPLALAAYYPEPPVGASFDIGGGVMINRTLGVGASLMGTAHEEIVGLGATVPHPFFFDATALASGATDEKLMRTEGSLNLQAMVVAYQSRRLRVRTFGGPSYFRYEADMVRDLSFSQTAFPFNRNQVVSISGYESASTEGTGWGWHVGGDVSVFFTRVFGLGGFARFSRGTVEIDEPLSESRADVRVGGVQAGGGIRLRF